MYTMCPNCGQALIDYGHTPYFQCLRCGRQLKSRTYELARPANITRGPDYLGNGKYPIYYGPPRVYYVYGKQSSIISDLMKLVKSVVGIFCILAIISFAVVLFFSFLTIGPSMLIVTHKTESLLNIITEYPFFIAIPVPPFLFRMPIQINHTILGIYFIIICSILILAFSHLFIAEGVATWRIIRNSILRADNPFIETNNSFILIAQLFFALLFFNVAYNFVLWYFGVVPTSGESLYEAPIWSVMYLLANASVYEELITRVLLIGVPLLIYEVLSHNLGLSESQHNSLFRYIVGGNIPIGSKEIYLILFSSLTFGLAHTPGWDYYKVLPTFISGIAFGYLFLSKGIHTAIILHFAFDYLQMPWRLANLQTFEVLSDLLILFWLLIGFIYFCYFSRALLKFSTMEVKRELMA